MKLASLVSKNPKNRDGELAVVNKEGSRYIKVPEIAGSLLEALRDWAACEPRLKKVYQELNSGSRLGQDLHLQDCLAPLPQAPGYYDGSAFLSHVVRARRARGDQMPESAKVTPLMYQGVSDNQLSYHAPLELVDPAYGGDFEGEIAVITTDVPRGVSAKDAGKHFALFTLFNDITLREIVKVELETKFGFLQSKPNSAYAPFAVTADEFGAEWNGERFLFDLKVKLNGALFGKPNGKEMHFTLGQLVAHAARTRPLSAGSIIGTGTFSNESNQVGFACLTEKRFQEVIDTGKPITPWLKAGDHVEMDVRIGEQSVFGPIDQTVR